MSPSHAFYTPCMQTNHMRCIWEEHPHSPHPPPGSRSLADPQNTACPHEVYGQGGPARRHEEWILGYRGWTWGWCRGVLRISLCGIQGPRMALSLGGFELPDELHHEDHVRTRGNRVESGGPHLSVMHRWHEGGAGPRLHPHRRAHLAAFLCSSDEVSDIGLCKHLKWSNGRPGDTARWKKAGGACGSGAQRMSWGRDREAPRQASSSHLRAVQLGQVAVLPPI